MIGLFQGFLVGFAVAEMMPGRPFLERMLVIAAITGAIVLQGAKQ